MQHNTATSQPRITFWGAARSVTGSMHLVEANGQQVLLDCGLVRDRHHHVHGRDHFPFEPAALSAVILSHAHIDHCGHLPALVRHGFEGPIYCTAPTRDLLAIMLANSARHHEEDTHVLNVVGQPGVPTVQPVFTRQDVAQTLAQCVILEYDEARVLEPGIELRLVDAGHILGSAMIALAIHGTAGTGRLVFTGDLGRRQPILLRPPAPVPEADLIVSESTYGSRTLEPLAETLAAFDQVVRRTVERGGKVLVPAFSLGRTQAVVHALEQSLATGRLPRIPVFVDSPTAAAISDVYEHHPERFAEKPDTTHAADMVRYLRSAEESRELDDRREPCVIISPSGMCDGGRILRHLSHAVDDPRCTVLLVSYQAPHTPGHQLLERGPTVRFHGRKWNKWADVIYLAGFSGHADRADLLALLAPPARPPRVRLVHGEPAEAEALADGLRQQGYLDVAIPERGESATIGA